MCKNMRVIITAGGTGGHIYPALAILNKIKEKNPDTEFLYIGTTDRMEKDLVPEMGIRYEGIKIEGLKRKISLKNINNIFNYFCAVKSCKKIIRDFDPNIVIGCGGYVTTPVIYAAKKLGYKTAIHEQNSVVGLSNKYLSKYADVVFTSFESTIKEFKKTRVYLTGNPCSEKAYLIEPAKKSDFNLSLNKKLILIVMGSLGSSTINDKIVSFLNGFSKKDYEVVFVTGNGYYNKIKDIDVPSNVRILPFIYNITSLMKVTDVLISRAGASTMSEIMAIGVPTIFIPSPYVANNHQYKNALDLVKRDAALMIIENDLNENNLFNKIDEAIAKKNVLRENVMKMGIKDSASMIYDIIVKEVKDE